MQHGSTAALAAAIALVGTLGVGPAPAAPPSSPSAVAPEGVRSPDVPPRAPQEADTVPAAVADSLRDRIRSMEARLDSLTAEIRRLRAEGTPEAAPGEADEEEDELAALRAAAQETAGRAARDTSGRGDSRTRNLSEMNPEISLTGDFVGSHASSDEEGEGGGLTAAPREFELSIQSALDPYTRMKFFLAHHEDLRVAGLGEAGGHGHGHGGVHADEEEGGGHGAEEEGGGGAPGGVFEVEEGYLYWVGLPGGVGLKAGRFRQEIGLYNRWHTHALFEVDRPLALTSFLGEDGLIQTGVGLTLPSVSAGPSTQTVYLEAARGENGALFEGSDELTWLGRLQSFWDLSPDAFLQLGTTSVYGENDPEALTSRLLSFDLYFRWSPSGRSLYRDLQVKSAWYLVDREEGGISETGSGGYLQAKYRMNRRWHVGVRGDYVDRFGEEVYGLSPHLTWWQSEWVRLRLQYAWRKPADHEAGHTFMLQTVWAVGPHKHETY